jgi:hypothetical protein
MPLAVVSGASCGCSWAITDDGLRRQRLVSENDLVTAHVRETGAIPLLLSRRLSRRAEKSRAMVRSVRVATGPNAAPANAPGLPPRYSFSAVPDTDPASSAPALKNVRSLFEDASSRASSNVFSEEQRLSMRPPTHKKSAPRE